MHEIHARKIACLALAMAVTIGVAVLAAFTLLHAEGVRSKGRAPAAAEQPARTAPGLASAPQLDMQQYRREQQQRLNSLGWEDRQAGIAHIPIEEAMDLIVQRAAAKGRAQ